MVLMVSTLWALPVLRPVLLTRREGDKAQLVTITTTDQDTTITYLHLHHLLTPLDFSWLPGQIILSFLLSCSLVLAPW